jgi:hypothetical protein
MSLITVLDDGFLIAINENGLPSATALIPAPMMSEEKRQENVNNAIKGVWLDGYFLESQTRVKNPVFDKKGEKTTTKIKFRACKNNQEAEFVLLKIIEIIGIPRENTKFLYGKQADPE